MSLRPGDPAPDFTATDHHGRRVTLADLLAQGAVVLFFYPKAHTGGCTAETCHFRDLGAEFAAAGAQRVGISRDDVGTQASFAEEQGLDYPLLADPDGSVARLFGAKRPGPLWSRRSTVVIDEDGSFLGEIRSETDMEAHADGALALLRTRASRRSA
jgi:thioredoxin-dependent peroxiredoxin